jgi:TolA-binding protein
VAEEQTPSRKGLWDYLGPGLSSAFATLIVTGVVWGAVAVRDMARSTADRVSALEQRDSDHEQRLRQQEQRPPRLNASLDELREKCESIDSLVDQCRERSAVMQETLRHVQSEQERLCQRVQSCQGGRR